MCRGKYGGGRGEYERVNMGREDEYRGEYGGG